MNTNTSENNLDRKALTWYLMLSFGIAWILFLVPLLWEAGSQASLTSSLLSWSAAMWVPGAAALLVTRFIQQKPLGSLNLKRLGPKRIYLWAWLVPLLASLGAGLITWLLGWGQLDLTFSQIVDAASEIPDQIPLSLPAVVAIQILAGILIGPLINTLFALGEELGWRGFLLPELLPLGQNRAILISGLIWGLWHIPVIVQGHNYPEAPVLGIFLMTAFTVLLGAFLSWLYFKTGSPWAPALGHGAVNAVAALSVIFFSEVNIIYGGTLTSVSGLIVLLMIIGGMYLTGKLPAEISEHVSRET